MGSVAMKEKVGRQKTHKHKTHRDKTHKHKRGRVGPGKDKAGPRFLEFLSPQKAYN